MQKSRSFTDVPYGLRGADDANEVAESCQKNHSPLQQLKWWRENSSAAPHLPL